MIPFGQVTFAISGHELPSALPRRNSRANGVATIDLVGIPSEPDCILRFSSYDRDEHQQYEQISEYVTDIDALP